MEAMQCVFCSHIAVLFVDSSEKLLFLDTKDLDIHGESDSSRASSRFCFVSSQSMSSLFAIAYSDSDKDAVGLIDQMNKIFSLDSSVDLMISLTGLSRAKFILTGNRGSVNRIAGSVTDNNSSTDLVCHTLQCLSLLCTSACSESIRSSVVQSLFSKHLSCSLSQNIVFAVAEALTRVSFLIIACPTPEEVEFTYVNQIVNYLRHGNYICKSGSARTGRRCVWRIWSCLAKRNAYSATHRGMAQKNESRIPRQATGPDGCP